MPRPHTPARPSVPSRPAATQVARRDVAALQFDEPGQSAAPDREPVGASEPHDLWSARSRLMISRFAARDCVGRVNPVPRPIASPSRSARRTQRPGRRSRRRDRDPPPPGRRTPPGRCSTPRMGESRRDEDGHKGADRRRCRRPRCPTSCAVSLSAVPIDVRFAHRVDQRDRADGHDGRRTRWSGRPCRRRSPRSRSTPSEAGQRPGEQGGADRGRRRDDRTAWRAIRRAASPRSS